MCRRQAKPEDEPIDSSIDDTDEDVLRPGNKVLDIPELVYHIAGYLDHADVACLALAAKYFWYLLKRHFVHLRGDKGSPGHGQRLSLLIRLTSDDSRLFDPDMTRPLRALQHNPDLPLCSQCAQVHRWHKVDFRHQWPRWQRGPSRRACWHSDTDITFYRTRIRIPQVQLDLVRQAYSLGPKYGLSPRTLVLKRFTDGDGIWEHRTRIFRLKDGNVALNISVQTFLEDPPRRHLDWCKLPKSNMNTVRFRVQMALPDIGMRLCMCLRGALTREIVGDCKEALALADTRLTYSKRDQRANGGWCIVLQRPARRCTQCRVYATVRLIWRSFLGHILEIERNWSLVGDIEPFENLRYDRSWWQNECETPSSVD